jgi:hypothetical protein
LVIEDFRNTRQIWRRENMLRGTHAKWFEYNF